jgi:hypothetical protein
VAKHVLKNARLFAGGVDLTGQSNKVELNAEFEAKDVTTFGSVDANGELWKEVIAGLGSASASASGFWEAGDASKVDNDMFASLGAIGPWTICPLAATDGSLAYILSALRSEYSLLDAVGEVAPFAGKAASTWPMARGRIIKPVGTARTSTGTGTITQLGALATGQSLYVPLHVVSVAGTTPSLTVAIQSAALVGFGSPTTQATFTAATAPGGQILRIAGPVTDQFWRVSYTISGSSPSFLFSCAGGIAAS